MASEVFFTNLPGIPAKNQNAVCDFCHGLTSSPAQTKDNKNSCEVCTKKLYKKGVLEIVSTAPSSLAFKKPWIGTPYARRAAFIPKLEGSPIETGSRKPESEPLPKKYAAGKTGNTRPIKKAVEEKPATVAASEKASKKSK